MSTATPGRQCRELVRAVRQEARAHDHRGGARGRVCGAQQAQDPAGARHRQRHGGGALEPEARLTSAFGVVLQPEHEQPERRGEGAHVVADDRVARARDLRHRRLEEEERGGAEAREHERLLERPGEHAAERDRQEPAGERVDRVAAVAPLVVEPLVEAVAARDRHERPAPAHHAHRRVGVLGDRVHVALAAEHRAHRVSTSTSPSGVPSSASEASPRNSPCSTTPTVALIAVATACEVALGRQRAVEQVVALVRGHAPPRSPARSSPPGTRFRAAAGACRASRSAPPRPAA